MLACSATAVGKWQWNSSGMKHNPKWKDYPDGVSKNIEDAYQTELLKVGWGAMNHMHALPMLFELPALFSYKQYTYDIVYSGKADGQNYQRQSNDPSKTRPIRRVEVKSAQPKQKPMKRVWQWNSGTKHNKIWKDYGPKQQADLE